VNQTRGSNLVTNGLEHFLILKYYTKLIYLILADTLLSLVLLALKICSANVSA